LFKCKEGSEFYKLYSDNLEVVDDKFTHKEYKVEVDKEFKDKIVYDDGSKFYYPIDSILKFKEMKIDIIRYNLVIISGYKVLWKFIKFPHTIKRLVKA
jgi:hypothetical protein